MAIARSVKGIQEPAQAPQLPVVPGRRPPAGPGVAVPEAQGNARGPTGALGVAAPASGPQPVVSSGSAPSGFSVPTATRLALAGFRQSPTRPRSDVLGRDSGQSPPHGLHLCEGPATRRGGT